ncbi:MAG: FAD-dependent oxidoreductase [Anaerolineaceae bacterium]
MKLSKVDVLIAGGGTAGVIAGIAAARNGAKTLIVDKQRCLGGQFTAGMLGAWVGFSDKEKVIVKGLAWELRNILKERNAIVEEDTNTDVCYLYDTEVAKVVLDEMVRREPNLSIFLNTSIIDVITEGNRISGVVVLSEMEQMEIRANVTVDCTGDAVVAAKAGVPYEIRPRKEIQPMTLMGKMAGVNMERLKQYYEDNPPVHDAHVPPAWQDFKTFPGLMHYGLRDELEKVQLPAHLEYLRNWLAIFTSTPNPGEFMINCSGAIEAHSIAGFEDRASQEVISQKCLYDVAEALRLYVPGFENAYLSSIASLLGIRESRRIIGDYKVTLEDFLAAREFEDSIGRGAMPAGAHTPDGVTMVVYDLDPGKSMTIPYRCMLPKNFEGLLVAGRCVSYDAPVANCIRCMAQCMAMGEAAGTAAAIAVEVGATPRNIDIKMLQEALRNQHAII